MSDDLAAEGDRLHASAQGYIDGTEFAGWAHANWPAIAAALRERDADPDAPAPIELVTELDVRLHGVSRARPITPAATWRLLLDEVSAALRERDELRDEFDARLGLYRDELATALDQLTTALEHIAAERVRAETAEALNASLTALLEVAEHIGEWEWSQIQEWLVLRDTLLAAHAAAVEARHD